MHRSRKKKGCFPKKKRIHFPLYSVICVYLVHVSIPAATSFFTWAASSKRKNPCQLSLLCCKLAMGNQENGLFGRWSCAAETGGVWPRGSSWDPVQGTRVRAGGKEGSSWRGVWGRRGKERGHTGVPAMYLFEGQPRCVACVRHSRAVPLSRDVRSTRVLCSMM